MCVCGAGGSSSAARSPGVPLRPWCVTTAQADLDPAEGDKSNLSRRRGSSAKVPPACFFRGNFDFRVYLYSLRLSFGWWLSCMLYFFKMRK